MKRYDVFYGKMNGRYTYRIAQNLTETQLNEFLVKYQNYQVIQIGNYIHEVYIG